MQNEEIKLLREGLKRKWEAVNKEYQQLTHKTKLDTVGLKRRYLTQSLHLFTPLFFYK